MLVTLKIKCKWIWSAKTTRRLSLFQKSETFPKGAKKHGPHAAAVQVCFLPIFVNITRLHYFLFKVMINQNCKIDDTASITIANFTSRNDNCEEPEPYGSHGSPCKTSLFSKPWLVYGWEELGCRYYCLSDRFSSILATKLQREISISQWFIGAYDSHIN